MKIDQLHVVCRGDGTVLCQIRVSEGDVYIRSVAYGKNAKEEVMVLDWIQKTILSIQEEARNINK